MQLSQEEYLRISEWRKGNPEATPTSIGHIATAPARPLNEPPAVLRRSPDVVRVTDALDGSSDVREEIVASLRARIESGEYRVSGDVVADMLVRRSLADQVR